LGFLAESAIQNSQTTRAFCFILKTVPMATSVLPHFM